MSRSRGPAARRPALPRSTHRAILSKRPSPPARSTLRSARLAPVAVRRRADEGLPRHGGPRPGDRESSRQRGPARENWLALPTETCHAEFRTRLGTLVPGTHLGLSEPRKTGAEQQLSAQGVRSRRSVRTAATSALFRYGPIPPGVAPATHRHPSVGPAETGARRSGPTPLRRGRPLQGSRPGAATIPYPP